jgi:hypothetical protein
VLYVDKVGLGDRVKDIHALLQVVLFQSEEEARFRGDQVDPIDVVVELVEGQLSQDLDTPKLRPKQVWAALTLLTDVCLIIFVSDGIFFVALDAEFLWWATGTIGRRGVFRGPNQPVSSLAYLLDERVVVA